jgi:hypothetical protein
MAKIVFDEILGPETPNRFDKYVNHNRFIEHTKQPGAYDDLIPSGRPSDGEIYAWAGGALIAGTVLAVVALGLLFRLFRWAAGF